jgi:hypothetical protein
MAFSIYSKKLNEMIIFIETVSLFSFLCFGVLSEIHETDRLGLSSPKCQFSS